MFIVRVVSKVLNFLFSCLIKGLFVIAPFLLTWYIVSWCIDISKRILGLGLSNYWIVFFVVLIMLCGYFTKNIIIRFFYDILEMFVLKIPGINFVYTSFKDLTSAFVEKKIKFDKPVLVCINAKNNNESDIKRIGFITCDDISGLSGSDDISVFIPQSFSFMSTGELLLVPKKNIIILENSDCSSIFKFVISAGFISIKKE